MNQRFITLIKRFDGILVVSVGTNPTFKARLVPHEVILTIPPLSHYVINICLYLSNRLHFFGSRLYCCFSFVLFSKRGEKLLLMKKLQYFHIVYFLVSSL